MTLPAGFNVALLVSDFTAVATPFVGLALLLSTGVLILRILKRA